MSGDLIDFGKRLHEKRVAEEEQWLQQAKEEFRVAQEAEAKRPAPPHPWLLMLDLVHTLRPEMTQVEAQECLYAFLRNADPSGRSAEAWSFYLDYGFELPMPGEEECA
jgi:hypothetical protein